MPRNGIEESRRCIELVETACDAGQDVAFDMHTRTFGLTNLYAVLPAWALSAEPEQLATILRDPAKRDEMRGHRSILSAGNDWSRVVLLDSEVWPEYSRCDLASIAADRGVEPLDAAYDLLLGGIDELQKLMVIIHAYSEDQQREAFRTDSASGLRRDPWLERQARRVVLPRRVHVGVVVLALHGPRRAAAHPRTRSSRLTGPAGGRIGLTERGVLRERARADVRSSTQASSPSGERSSNRTCLPTACGTCL